LNDDTEFVEMLKRGKALPPEFSSPLPFVFSIPTPGLVTQIDEHTIDQYIVTSDGVIVAPRVYGAALLCIKTAAILSAVLSLEPLEEDDYMRLIKGALEPKDILVKVAECQHPWPCFSKPAIVFHNRDKIITSERARQILVDRFNINFEQALPYIPSAKGTAEALFLQVRQRIEHRLPNPSHGVHNASAAVEARSITLGELERYFIQTVVDDYQQDWDKLRGQRRSVLWEQAVAERGVPHYQGSPDDLKLLLTKAVNRKTPGHGYRLHNGMHFSFQGCRYFCGQLSNQLAEKEFEVYYDRRDVSVLYLFVDGSYVGEAYSIQFVGRRISVWEALTIQRADKMHAKQSGHIRGR
jgi:hypothetical protein